MRKVVSVVLICILCICHVGCGAKKAADTTIKAPDSIEKDIEVETLESGVTLYEGFIYAKDSFGKYDYYPYVENKVDGVVYVDDANLEGREDKEAACRYFNMPKGCGTLSIYGNVTGANVFNKGGTVPPKFAWPEGYLTDPEYLKGIDYKLHPAEEVFRGTGEGEHNTSIKMRSVDVQGFSFAMYEDFYEDPQTVNISIYGVKISTLKDKLGDTCTYSELINMVEKIKKKGFKEVDLLASKLIDTTGVYYIDWKALDINSDYGTYIIGLDFKTDKSGYYMYGGYLYEIEDTTEYNVWKKANKDKFIAG